MVTRHDQARPSLRRRVAAASKFDLVTAARVVANNLGQSAIMAGQLRFEHDDGSRGPEAAESVRIRTVHRPSASLRKSVVPRRKRQFELELTKRTHEGPRFQAKAQVRIRTAQRAPGAAFRGKAPLEFELTRASTPPPTHFREPALVGNRAASEVRRWITLAPPSSRVRRLVGQLRTW